VAVDDPERGWLLAIDTSSTAVSLALGRAGVGDGQRRAEITWDARRDQTATLLSQLDNLLNLNTIETSDLGGIAVTTGPGSFSALRVGLATAKGLCLAHGIPIFGVGTLDATAAQFEGWGRPARALVAAGRKRVVAGDYRPGLTGLTLAAALEHRPLDRLADGLTEPTLLVGDLDPQYEALYRDLDTVIVPPPSARRLRASILIDMVIERWHKGESDDLATLEPIYVHSRPTATGSSTF
jgi:tRNA threonylcarbamoyladenosine biosynthesis protein TsaB